MINKFTAILSDLAAVQSLLAEVVNRLNRAADELNQAPARPATDLAAVARGDLLTLPGLETSSESVPKVRGSTLAAQPPATFRTGLENVRVARGWTQAELARRSGVHQTGIARMERRKTYPKLDTATRLANALGVSVPELVKGMRHGHAKGKTVKRRVPTLSGASNGNGNGGPL